MSEAIKFIPPRVPLTDPRTGLISREWFLFLQGVFIRIGGSTGQSIPDVVQDLPDDAGLEELKTQVYDQSYQFGQAPPLTQLAYEEMLSEITSLRDQVAELTKMIQDQQQNPSA